MTGAYDETTKWMRGYGTRLVWNSASGKRAHAERVGGGAATGLRRRPQVGGRARTGDVHVERAVEAERRRERRDDLRDEAVEVGVRRALDVEVAAADVVERLVVDHEGDIGVLEERVRREHAAGGKHEHAGEGERW
jgi:hypothetical protein